MIRFFFLLLATALFSCKNGGNSKDVTTITKPAENITATKDQMERRLQSEAYCKLYEIPVYGNKNSLFVEPENKITLRIQDEVVDRTIALCFIELKSEKADKQMLADFDKRYNAIKKVSKKEKAFILSDNPTEQQIVDANWRAEGVHVMLWALGYIDSLKYPDSLCNVADDFKHLFSVTEQEFRRKAKLRSKKEIMDQADLILRLDWACVNARVKNLQAPGRLDSGVVLERHYALNWLIQYMNQEWDDVTTDT